MTPRPDRPADHLAEGLAIHVERWACELGADAATQRLAGRAAAAVSRATSEGHVCIGLDELLEAPDGDATALRDRLLASGVVGTPAAPRALPLIVDADGRLYLQRYFDFERRLAARLVLAAQAAPAVIDAAARARLDTLFAANEAGLAGADWQKAAAALALRGRLAVVSGGPGTGKTTTVVNLLACLVAQQPGCRIALAAPTGKAAARMGEALRERAAHLPAELRAQLPGDATTVHRLLGVTPAGGRFVHHAGHPLAIDVLVVDEASMLDLALATRLLEAVPASARIVLLGDKDQLAAVESGAVFAELSAQMRLGPDCRALIEGLCRLAPGSLAAPADAKPGPLDDTVVWFTRNFRFAADSGIGRLAADVQGGRARAALAGLEAGADDSLRWIDDAAAQPGAALLDALFDGYAPYLDALRRNAADPAAVTQAFGRFRVLCALRDGPRGVAAINDRLERQARAALAPLQPDGADPRSPWFVGRPVMVLRNDPLLGLFNGDIGLTLPDGTGALAVVFKAAGGGFKALPPLRLPEHQGAFALTVHKAQGSEFDAVLVLLPQGRSPVLTRELLYTAVTRARRRVTLAGGTDAIGHAVLSPTRRRSGLLARLQEAAGGGP
jgi:exodeoxyribonuclease V alpha subunit